MSICDIPTAIAEIKAGNMLILMDDADRENEGDLIIAAEHITPEIINFMVTHGRGLVCLALSPEIVDRLQLSLMTQTNNSRFGTNFTVSIEARKGVTTGISAADRATTILTAIAANAGPNDIASPGHIFPLRAHEAGVLVRAGQTEGSVDLAKLAGLKHAAVICEIMNPDGTMARLQDLEKFAAQHKLKIALIKDLIKYRLRHDPKIIKQTGSSILPTDFGDFKIITYESEHDSATHLALVKGDITSDEPTLVRVHSECLTGDVFGSKRCDCGEQLKLAMQQIANIGTGVIVYLRQEGRGIGLSHKIKAYNLQDQGMDTISANEALGFAADLRDYGIGAQILADLGVTKMRLLTNNPKKIAGLQGHGLEIVEHVPLEVSSNPHNLAYLKTKKSRMGHLLTLEEKS